MNDDINRNVRLRGLVWRLREAREGDHVIDRGNQRGGDPNFLNLRPDGGFEEGWHGEGERVHSAFGNERSALLFTRTACPHKHQQRGGILLTKLQQLAQLIEVSIVTAGEGAARHDDLHRFGL